MHGIIEQAKDSLSRWLGQVELPAQQKNRPFEADCEIIGQDEAFDLACTVDSISDEIAGGLYKNPYTQGWVSAAASLSDLAAVGATPLGMLFSATWGPEADDDFKQLAAQGLKDCLGLAQVALLGGDTGYSRSTVLGTTGLGLVEKGRAITRIGLEPGDVLVLAGPVGNGPALALRWLLDAPEADFPESFFRPAIAASVKQAFRRYAKAMLDTSDGCLASCVTLCGLNRVGLDLAWQNAFFTEESRLFCERMGLPLWMLWLAEHGDYQLLAGVAAEDVSKVLAECPLATVVGTVTEREEIRLGKMVVDPSHSFLVGQTPAHLRAGVCRELIKQIKGEGYP